MKTRALRLLALLLLLSLSRPVAASPPATHDRAALAARVKAETLYAWHAYEKYAWGHDGLPAAEPEAEGLVRRSRC